MLWRRSDGAGLERCVIESTPDGHRIGGTALLVSDGASHEIRYSVLTDSLWRTRTVGAHVQGPGGDRRLALTSDGEGSWSMSDTPVVDLYGALDIDLAWTPATNTVPIRRLGLAVGDTAETTVAWIDFPGHDIARKVHRYTRIGPHAYLFESAGATYELEVSEDGIVRTYPQGWETVATP